MEKGEANRLGIDRLLARWALDEGIIEGKRMGSIGCVVRRGRVVWADIIVMGMAGL